MSSVFGINIFRSVYNVFMRKNMFFLVSVFIIVFMDIIVDSVWEINHSLIAMAFVWPNSNIYKKIFKLEPIA